MLTWGISHCAGCRVNRDDHGFSEREPGLGLPMGRPRPPIRAPSNNLIKRIKRAAFGFRNFANYRIRALLYAGKPNTHTCR